MAEIILEVLLRRKTPTTAHTSAPEISTGNTPTFAEEVFAPLLPDIEWSFWENAFAQSPEILLFRPWLQRQETPKTQSGVRPHPSAPNTSSGSVFSASSASTLDAQSIEDLDPSVYGWVSSNGDGWTWEQLLESLFESLGLPKAHGEWILWIGFLVLLATLWLFGLSVHDRLLLFFLPPKKKTSPRGGKAIAIRYNLRYNIQKSGSSHKHL